MVYWYDNTIVSVRLVADWWGSSSPARSPSKCSRPGFKLKIDSLKKEVYSLSSSFAQIRENTAEMHAGYHLHGRMLRHSQCSFWKMKVLKKPQIFFHAFECTFEDSCAAGIKAESVKRPLSPSTLSLEQRRERAGGWCHLWTRGWP